MSDECTSDDVVRISRISERSNDARICFEPSSRPRRDVMSIVLCCRDVGSMVRPCEAFNSN